MRIVSNDREKAELMSQFKAVMYGFGFLLIAIVLTFIIASAMRSVEIKVIPREISIKYVDEK